MSLASPLGLGHELHTMPMLCGVILSPDSCLPFPSLVEALECFRVHMNSSPVFKKKNYCPSSLPKCPTPQTQNIFRLFSVIGTLVLLSSCPLPNSVAHGPYAVSPEAFHSSFISLSFISRFQFCP